MDKVGVAKKMPLVYRISVLSKYAQNRTKKLELFWWIVLRRVTTSNWNQLMGKSDEKIRYATSVLDFQVSLHPFFHFT